MTHPLARTLAEAYLGQRRVLHAARHPALRFHPSYYYRDLRTGRTSSYPALIAAVTDAAGTVTGVHRTWLDPDGVKAKVENPHRALGGLPGNACASAFPLTAPLRSWPPVRGSRARCR